MSNGLRRIADVIRFLGNLWALLVMLGAGAYSMFGVISDADFKRNVSIAVVLASTAAVVVGALVPCGVAYLVAWIVDGFAGDND